MHLERIVGSDTRIKVLRTLFQEGLPRLDGPTLATETGRSPAGVNLALRELLGSRILVEEKRGQKRVVGVHVGHPQFPSLRALFEEERTRSEVPHLFPTYWNHLEIAASRLASLRGVAAVILFGSFTRPPIYPGSDVDLLVIGERKPTKSLPDIVGHPVRALWLKPEQVQAKVAADDGFLRSALERYVVLHQAPGYALAWTAPERKRRRGRP